MLIIKLFLFLTTISAFFKEKLWKWCYQKIAKSYQENEWQFLNYGYAPAQEGDVLPLKKEDEKNRVFIQLYQHVLKGVDLKGKEVLEVGSGRGGGSDFVARYFDPSMMTGVDFAKNAVDLSNRFYSLPNLRFIEGNAESLPFENERFDVVINVESSHCYGNMKAFVEEVERVLKPGGIFSWADLRSQKAMENDDAIFRNSSLKLLSKENITPHVLKALDEISERKKEALRKHVPVLWRSIFFEFAGVKDSKIYRELQVGSMVYYCYRLQKSSDSGIR